MYNLKFVKILCLLLIFSFAGCETVKLKYVDSDDFPKDKVYRLKAVYLKDGSTVDLSGKEAKFKREYKGKQNVIVYYVKDYDEAFIQLKDISSLKIEVVESNTLVNVLIIVVPVVIAVLVWWMYSAAHWKAH